MATKADYMGWLRTAAFIGGVLLAVGGGWALAKSDIAVNAAEIRILKEQRTETNERLIRIEEKVDDIRERLPRRDK